ncbi:hypothetical protein GOP47_0027948 [Adiantum capillus-veneris]|nr:hypothetical protein GOP47_0027948 [Adiantum capillus-veneris]
MTKVGPSKASIALGPSVRLGAGEQCRHRVCMYACIACGNEDYQHSEHEKSACRRGGVLLSGEKWWRYRETRGLGELRAGCRLSMLNVGNHVQVTGGDHEQLKRG